MRTKDRIYELLQDKTSSQFFYNQMMMGMVNPKAINLFKDLRNDDEIDVQKLRREFLTLEAKPLIFSSFITGKKAPGLAEKASVFKY